MLIDEDMLNDMYSPLTCSILDSHLNVQSIVRCNILEDDGEPVEFDKSARASGWIVLHAFEILTLKLKVKGVPNM